MQIHEITKRPVSEQLPGLGGAIADRFVQSQLGVSPSTTSPIGGNVAKSQAALNINQALAGALGKQMAKAWQVAVQNFMRENLDASGNPMTNVKNARPSDAAVLRAELNKMITGAIKLPEGTRLDTWPSTIKTDDPADAEKARRVVNDLKNLEELIWKETLEPSDAQGRVRTDAFVKLGQSIAVAQNIQEFFSNTARATADKVTMDRAGNILVNGKPYNPADPAQRAAVAEFMRTRTT